MNVCRICVWLSKSMTCATSRFDRRLAKPTAASCAIGSFCSMLVLESSRNDSAIGLRLAREVRDVLDGAVLEDLEVRLLETGDEPACAVEHGDAEQDDVRAAAKDLLRREGPCEKRRERHARPETASRHRPAQRGARTCTPWRLTSTSSLDGGTSVSGRP